MNIMTRQRLDRLEEIAHSLWINETMQWSAQSASLALKEKISHILCQAVCQWVGLHITTERVPRLARHLLNLVEGASSIGIAHLRARASRRHLESWSASLIREIRCGERKAEDDCILRVIALHEQTHGDLLPERIAAVELLNILRPTVAVTYYILLAAVALHDHPQEAGNITDDRSLTHFVQEVRRYYPFFPVVAARVRQDFEWNGYRFPQGYRALLDLYASNHDERVWETPQRFLPQRFGNARQSPFILIPQGGGDPWRHHRCAGEALTVDMMKLAVKMLNAEITYDVQSSTSLHGIPAQPAHGLRIFRVASNLAHRTV